MKEEITQKANVFNRMHGGGGGGDGSVVEPGHKALFFLQTQMRTNSHALFRKTLNDITIPVQILRNYKLTRLRFQKYMYCLIFFVQ